MITWFFYLLTLAIFVMVLFDDICELVEKKDKRLIQLTKLLLDLILYFVWNYYYLTTWY